MEILKLFAPGLVGFDGMVNLFPEGRVYMKADVT